MRNALMLALLFGFVFNVFAIPVPAAVRSALEMLSRAALPAALFGLGGILTRYALRASLGESGMILALSLVLHPAIGYVLAAHVFHLSEDFVRAVVVTAAMAPESIPTSSPASTAADRRRRRAPSCSAPVCRC